MELILATKTVLIRMISDLRRILLVFTAASVDILNKRLHVSISLYVVFRSTENTAAIIFFLTVSNKQKQEVPIGQTEGNSVSISTAPIHKATH